MATWALTKNSVFIFNRNLSFIHVPKMNEASSDSDSGSRGEENYAAKNKWVMDARDSFPRLPFRSPREKANKARVCVWFSICLFHSFFTLPLLNAVVIFLLVCSTDVKEKFVTVYYGGKKEFFLPLVKIPTTSRKWITREIAQRQQQPKMLDCKKTMLWSQRVKKGLI